jgi:hypothetical protein
MFPIYILILSTLKVESGLKAHLIIFGNSLSFHRKQDNSKSGSKINMAIGIKDKLMNRVRSMVCISRLQMLNLCVLF